VQIPTAILLGVERVLPDVVEADAALSEVVADEVVEAEESVVVGDSDADDDAGPDADSAGVDGKIDAIVDVEKPSMLDVDHAAIPKVAGTDKKVLLTPVVRSPLIPVVSGS